MTEDEYLLQLARAITKREDLIAAEIRPILLELALRIRALLFQSFGYAVGQPLRALLYNQLRPQILTLLQQLVDLYFTQIRTTLPDLYPLLATTHSRFARTTTPIPTPPLTDLLTGTTVLNRSARDLLAPGPTGISPLTLQLERLLDTTIQPALLLETPTDKLLASLVAVRTSTGTESGVLTPLIRKGTVINAWLDRLGATTAALLWSLNTPIQQEAVADNPPDFWRWNAILDPKTCPICRPLDGTTAPTPTAFPSGAPPVHPRCRCITVPIFS
jgi:SPP1 gp7 family putative phage head morphogenesis protein